MDHLNGKGRVRRSLIPGLLVSGVAIVGLVVVTDPSRAFHVLLAASPWELVLSAVCCSLGLVARAAASREFINGRVGLGASFAALNIGYLANNLLPLRAGEAIRSVVLGRRSGLGVVGGATAVAAERLLDVGFAATILIAALPAVGVDAGWATPVTAALVAFVGVVVLIVVARHRKTIAAWFEVKLARWPRIARLPPIVADAFDGLARPSRLLRGALWLGLSWTLGLAFFLLVLRAFIPGAPLSWVAFGVGVLAFGIALPSSPGALGIYEASLVGALALCGVPSADSLAFAVAAHALSFALTSIFGLVALVRQVPGGAGISDKAKILLGNGESPVLEEKTQQPADEPS